VSELVGKGCLFCYISQVLYVNFAIFVILTILSIVLLPKEALNPESKASQSLGPKAHTLPDARLPIQQVPRH